MNLTSAQIIDLLVKQNYLKKEEIDSALQKAPSNVFDQLLQDQVLTKELLGQAIAEFYGLEYFNFEIKKPDVELLKEFSKNLLFKYNLVPISFKNKEIDFTTSNPELIKELQGKFKKSNPDLKIHFQYSNETDIKTFLSSIKDPLKDRLASYEPNAIPDIFNEILNDAIDLKASDIHMEPQEDKSVVIKFRIDGILKIITEITYDLFQRILNRIKIQAGLRIDEHNKAQDGALRYHFEERVMDFRISIVPVLNGEKIAIRILSDYIRSLSLEELGLSERNQKLISDSYKKTYGMILTTGPTGSGKTTTLYAVIKKLKRPEINITTIEDPIEYRIPGINQIQINEKNNITFANGLRSIVRQDPNLILVGEIRDNETAEIAVNAALTGHLLLSTFHANDAATSIPRLIDMGIEPFLLSSTINLIIAQRLVRRLCPNCRYSYEITNEEIKQNYDYFPKKILKEGMRFYKGKGCTKCNDTGFQGRVGIFELIYITKEIQELIMSNPTSQEIWAIASKQGAISLFEDGWEKVESGITSIDELVRVAPITLSSTYVYEEKK